MMFHDELSEAIFTPLDAPFSPFSYSDDSSTSTYMMSPGDGSSSSSTTSGTSASNGHINGNTGGYYQQQQQQYEIGNGEERVMTIIPESQEVPSMPSSSSSSSAAYGREHDANGLIMMPSLMEQQQHGGTFEDEDDDLDGFIDLLDQPYYDEVNTGHETMNGNGSYHQYHHQEARNEDSNGSMMMIPPPLPFIKQEAPHFDSPLPQPQQQELQQEDEKGEGGIRCVFDTKFHEKYWRNDRKNLQCFPVCPEFGDYYYLRMNNLKHSSSGGATCSSPVAAHIEGGDLNGRLIALSRINLVTDDGKSTNIRGGLTLSGSDFQLLEKHCLEGRVNGKDIIFSASCWKLTVELSKKRRPKDMPNMAPKYCFEVICLQPREDGSYYVLCNVISRFFHIASTRTLAREIEAKDKNKSKKRELDDASTISSSSTSQANIIATTTTGACEGATGASMASSTGPVVQQQQLSFPDEMYNNPDEYVDYHQHTTKRARTDLHLFQQKERRAEDETNDDDDIKHDYGNSAKAAVLLTRKPTPPLPSLQEQQQRRFAPEDEEKQHESSAEPVNVGHQYLHEQQVAVDEPQTAIPAIIVEDVLPDIKIYQLGVAYRMCIFLGLFGGHQFYLGRPGWGIVYMFTLGLFGVGWIYDLIRLPTLVDKVNRQEIVSCTMGEAYVTWLVLGLFGGHRYALGHVLWGIYYTCTFASLGVAWVIDLFRIPTLYSQRHSADYQLLDVYILWFPGGLLGIHHFYLKDYKMGFLYAFTFGLLGFGWMADGFRISSLVANANANQINRSRSQEQQQQGVEMT